MTDQISISTHKLVVSETHEDAAPAEDVIYTLEKLLNGEYQMTVISPASAYRGVVEEVCDKLTDTYGEHAHKFASSLVDLVISRTCGKPVKFDGCELAFANDRVLKLRKMPNGQHQMKIIGSIVTL
jgi:hypothetical protein